MERTKEALERQFACLKCHGRTCTVQDVAFAGGPLSRMLPVGSHRYFAVSCTLCGFTEFYNLALIDHVEEPAPGKAKLAEGTENA